MSELKPKSLWIWGRMCEKWGCLESKNESGYCPRHEFYIRRRKAFFEKLRSWIPGLRSASIKENIRPRSPRELGLYD